MALKRDAAYGKHELTNLLRRLIDDEGFAEDEFVVTGSARMLMTGHRTRISDIDIVARGETWHRAVELVSLGRGYTEFTAISGAMVVRLYEGLVEVCDTWFMGEADTDDLIEGAEVMEGLRFITHEDLVAYKRKLNRPKDRSDLAALAGRGSTISDIGGVYVTPVPRRPAVVRAGAPAL